MSTRILSVLLLTILSLIHVATSNSALEHNTNSQKDKTVQIAITVQGSHFYYAICATIGATTIGSLLPLQWNLGRTEPSSIFVRQPVWLRRLHITP